MNWKVLGAGAVLVVPLVVVLASGFGRNPQLVSNALEGKEARLFTLQSLDGETVALGELAGKPVVLNFWASWCGPCLQEHSSLLASERAFAKRGVAFFGVLYGDEAENAQEFLRKHGQAYPTLLDPGNVVAIDYGVAGVPETFVLDQQGRVVKKFSGPVRYADLAEVLEPLL